MGETGFFSGLSDFVKPATDFMSNNKDSLEMFGGIGGKLFDIDAMRKQRKADAGRYDTLMGINLNQMNRTNRLEDERQKSIDEVYGSQQPKLF